jgi:hypothetical protein
MRSMENTRPKYPQNLSPKVSADWLELAGSVQALVAGNYQIPVIRRRRSLFGGRRNSTNALLDPVLLHVELGPRVVR